MKLNSKINNALLVALVAASGTAAAGQRLVLPVNINDTSRYANGTIADARGSADSQQWLGCLYNTSIGICYAANATGVSRSCSTSNPDLLNIIRSLTPESYIYFQWNTDGTCNYILVENSSRFKPLLVSGT
jgi:hypothetical protein